MEIFIGICIAVAVGLLATVCFLLAKKAVFIKSLQDKHVFITGASSGIGLAIAKKCLLEGAFVTFVSRSLKNLEGAADKLLEETQCGRDKIQYQVADVGDYAAITASVRQALLWKPIDVLVCNAGLTRGGYLEKSSLEDIDTVIRTNLNGSIYPLHEALPSLKEHSATHPVSIVFISSLASFMFMYGHAAYTASKYAVRGLAESLRCELLPYSNMRVTLMCPGFVNTPFLDELDNQGEITEVLHKVNLLNKKSSESPEHAASCTVESLKRGSYLVVTQPIGHHMLALGRGVIPADSVGRNLFELIMLVPFRILSLIFGFNIRSSVLTTVRKYRKA
ncbi:hypothetical protein GOP47_0023842 [Adiantum capillus-veneris]|uniref:Ketoreductase domain-containing protein n=1 Tax=Adiantum capillus-veneris TaxID=13818 RepID=A0A9D4U4N4_ADICA|nr:hypothetical protein GOP47_0023842 [Adiantum capillus-veneris]